MIVVILPLLSVHVLVCVMVATVVATCIIGRLVMDGVVPVGV